MRSQQHSQSVNPQQVDFNVCRQDLVSRPEHDEHQIASANSPPSLRRGVDLFLTQSPQHIRSTCSSQGQDAASVSTFVTPLKVVLLTQSPGSRRRPKPYTPGLEAEDEEDDEELEEDCVDSHKPHLVKRQCFTMMMGLEPSQVLQQAFSDDNEEEGGHPPLSPIIQVVDPPHASVVECSQTQIVLSQTQIDDDAEDRGGDDDSPNLSQRFSSLTTSVEEATPTKSTLNTSTQSSIFSARWDQHNSHNSSSHSSSHVALSSDPCSFNPEDEDVLMPSKKKKKTDGWDERWSVDEQQLFSCGGEEDDDAQMIFARVKQSMIDDQVDEESVQAVFMSLLTTQQMQHTQYAPACDRLKRRLLHRPSQETTQTVAAPMSTLEWIRRSSAREDPRRKGCRMDETPCSPDSIGERLVNKMRELNICADRTRQELALSMKTLDSELRSIVGGGLTSYQLEVLHSSGNDGDSMDVLCLVKERATAFTMTTNLQSLHANLESNDFTREAKLPLITRVAGPWRPSPASAFVMLDLKFVLASSTWVWAVRAFFSKPRPQVRDIVGHCRRKIIIRHREGGHEAEHQDVAVCGLMQFLQAIRLLGRRMPITNWEDLLQAYHDDGLAL